MTEHLLAKPGREIIGTLIDTLFPFRREMKKPLREGTLHTLAAES